MGIALGEMHLRDSVYDLYSLNNERRTRFEN